MNYQPPLLYFLSIFTLATSDTLSWDIVSTGGTKAGHCQNQVCTVSPGENILISIIWTFSNPTENPRVQIADIRKLLFPQDDTYFYICADKKSPTGMTFTTNNCTFTINKGNYRLKTYAFNVPDLPGKVKQLEEKLNVWTFVKFGNDPAIQTVWPGKTLKVFK